MGKGKGDVDQYVARVKRGRVMFELTGLDPETSKKALVGAGKKLPVKTIVIIKGDIR